MTIERSPEPVRWDLDPRWGPLIRSHRKVERERRPLNSLVALLREAGVPERALNSLYRARKSESWFREATDEELLELDGIGKRGLEALRRIIPAPSDRIQLLEDRIRELEARLRRYEPDA